MRAPSLHATAVLALLSAACAPDEPAIAVSTDAVSAAAVARGNAGGNKRVTVMTRNLYLGADLGPVIAAGSLEAFVLATSEVWATVSANDAGHAGGGPDVLARLDAVADEIAATSADLVGLQEVYRWAIAPGATPAPGDFAVVFDYLAVLLEKLAARGLAYEAVANLQLFQFAAPVVTATGLATVRMTDRQVILARREPGLHVSSPQEHVFGDMTCPAENPTCLLLSPAVLGQPVPIPRGWTAVDVRYRGETFRFVNTHLEAFHPLVRVAQAQELAAALADAPGRVVLVGDLNSRPGAEGHLVMTSAGLADAWTALHPEPAGAGAEGMTCCFPEELRLPGALDERIDLVLVRGPVVPLEVAVVGDGTPDTRVALGDGTLLWPSDHAGVVATLRLLDDRFFALVP
jgi:endonuclease/exonuclease/phosphatase family metal-dependent hydrolase